MPKKNEDKEAMSTNTDIEKNETILDKTTAAPGLETAADSFLDADIVIEDRAYGSIYPIVQWINGAPDRKREGGLPYTGGFFCSKEQGVVLPGAVEHTLVTKDGDEVPGYAIRDLTFTVIRDRRRWSVSGPRGFDVYYGHGEYDEAAATGTVRGNLHLLVVVKGMEEPIVLTFRGNAARAMVGMGKDRGVVPSFGQKLLGKATRLAREKARKQGGAAAGRASTFTYPRCAFWLTTGPERNADQSPLFTEVGEGEKKSKVTLPVWIDEPAEVTAEVCNRLYVGGNALALHQGFHADADLWIEEWSDATLAAARARNEKTKPDAATKDAGTTGTGKEAGNSVPKNTELPF